MNTQVVSRERSIFLSKLNFPSSSSDHRLQDEGNSDVEGKVKNRLLSMWNNVKYGENFITLNIDLITQSASKQGRIRLFSGVNDSSTNS
jgi:hypothetical protein